MQRAEFRRRDAASRQGYPHAADKIGVKIGVRALFPSEQNRGQSPKGRTKKNRALTPIYAASDFDAFTHHVRLVAVEEAGERVLGEYTFLHTPS